MEKGLPDDTPSSPYEDTATVGRTASWGSGVTWTNNPNDRGVRAYSYEYGYDKVGNRTSLLIEAVDAATEISVDWTYEYNTLNQLKKRYDGAAWTGADGDTR